MVSILEKKNELIFYALAGPLKKMAIRQHGLRQICKITQLQTQNTKTVYTTRLK